MRPLPLLICLPILLLCCAAKADAIPIVITGGSISAGAGNGNFTVNLTGLNFSFRAGDLGAPRQQICGLCSPGSAFPGTIQVRLTNDSFFRQVMYNGMTYGPADSVITLGQSLLITLPPLTIPTDLSPIVTPFTFSGAVTVTPRDGSAPLTFELTGAGTVTFTFSPSAGLGSTLGPTVFAFGAQPVPEPATLALLGTGLAAVVGAVRRRRRS